MPSVIEIGIEFGPAVFKQTNKQSQTNNNPQTKTKTPGIVMSTDLWGPLSSKFNLLSKK